MMSAILTFFGIVVAVLLGAIGVLAGIIRSEEKRDAKAADSYIKAYDDAAKKVNEEKRKNEEKIKEAHSGNKLDNATAVVDLLRK